MSKKNIIYKLFTIVLCAALLVSCGSNSVQKTDGTSEATANTGSDAVGSNAVNITKAVAITSEMVSYDSDDYYSDWESQNPNYFKLDGTSIDSSGSGAVVEGGNITIIAAGVYVISGKLDNGRIIVDVQNKEAVRLVLNGMDITCTDNAPIYVKNAGKVIISLQDGTQNYVTDGEKYTFTDAEAEENEPDAAIFSKDNLTINGTGTLTVHGNFNNGIKSKDDLKITGGNINIYSVDDGLTGRDMVLVKDGSINIEAEGDGIKATNDEDESNGYVAIEGGTFDIKAGADGIQAATSVLITNGKFNLITGGGSVNGTNKGGGDMQNKFGNREGNTTVSSTEDESQSAKGIKALSNITINGGTFVLDSSDDAIHSNNSITIVGGDITINSGDDGIHADSSIAIKGGKINIVKSYEGIESLLISVSDGEIHVVSSDDGINISGGNDGSSVNGRPGQNNFGSSGSGRLDINGGYIGIDATGDGVDANGSVYMTAGTVAVSGPTSSGNGALDYDGVFEMSGGFIVAEGSSGMVQAPSEQSTQYSLVMSFSNVQQAGTIIHIEDGKGGNVATFAPAKNYQTVVVCSPQLKKDTEYVVYSGGTSSGSLLDGLYTEGVYQAGTKITDFKVSDNITWLSETGVTTGMSANPGFGGNAGKPPKGRR